ALSSTVSVHTLAPNVFAVVLEVRGAASPVTVEAIAAGTLSGSGTASVVHESGEVVTVDLSPQGAPAFGLAFRGSVPVVGRNALSGTSYLASLHYELRPGETLGFLLAFADGTGGAQAVLSSADVPASPSQWLPRTEASWAAYFASFARSAETSPVRARADRQAMAILRHNALASPQPGLGRGLSSAKSHRNHFYLWDSALASLALSEASPSRAFEVLGLLQRAQRTAEGDPERGVIPHHVDENGVGVPPGVSYAPDVYSAPPLLPSVWRVLYERSAKGPADVEAVERGYQSSGELLNWWTRRRDKDADGLAEPNGSLEGGAANSPRFLEIWGDTEQARLPAFEFDTRARINAVDINAWRYLGGVELSRVGRLLGKADADAWLSRAGLLAPAAEGAPPIGFWATDRNGYFDFTRSSTGAATFLSSRTPALWWPLVAGQARDPVKVKQVVGTLLDSSAFWGPHGIPSAAFNDPRFSARDGFRGPVFASTNYFTAQALYRYGYEDEAAALRHRTLELLSAQPCLWTSYEPRSGEGLGACGDVTTAAVQVELMRDRHQEEAFAVKQGGLAPSREGRLRRLFRLGDGKLLFEVAVGGTYELPVTRVASKTQIFADEAMTFTFTDPSELIGNREIRVTLPVLAEASVRITRVDRTVETAALLSGDEPISVTARVGDTVEIQRFRLAGDRQGCGCGTGGGEALGLGGLLALGLA
ncbi:MAG TPA: hypothetical protein VK447_08780, partial [Myxococcaceae bacterium]|nr:hypothetical protein [Myxococcaceae bacterium]